MQKDHHGDDPLGAYQLSEIQAVMRQPVDRETAGVGVFFKDKEQGLAAPIGPFHQQRRVELAKALAETLLQLLLANRQDSRSLVDGR